MRDVPCEQMLFEPRIEGSQEPCGGPGEAFLGRERKAPWHGNALRKWETQEAR